MPKEIRNPKSERLTLVGYALDEEWAEAKELTLIFGAMWRK
jgi:hypothetical protein